MAFSAVKRRRLQSLVGLKGITVQALEAVMRNLHDDPIEPLSDWRIKKFIAEQWSEVSHTIDLPLESGGGWAWSVCRLDKLMRYVARDSALYRGVLRAALMNRPGQPLTLVMYLDEVTPGNVLRPDNLRKFWAVYISFRELPTWCLTREQFWLPIAVLRTSMSTRIKGGISNCCRLLLRSILFDPCNAVDVGFAVALGEAEGDPQLIRVALGNILGDESALKYVFSNKGASGLRCCLLCRNVVSMSSDLVSGQNYLVDISCGDPSLFDPATNESIWTTYDHLASQKRILNKTAFAKLEKACGFTWDEDSLLADIPLRRHLRPATAYTMDWLHNYLCHGILAFEVNLLLDASRQAVNLSYEQLHQFVNSDWTWPRNQAVHKISDVFSASAAKHAAEGFRGSASQLLMLFPLLRYFVSQVLLPTGKLNAACQSFCQLCQMMDEFMLVKQGRAARDRVLPLFQRFMLLHKRAYGVDALKPKHHFGFHNILGLADGGGDDVWLDCFVHERKHQVVKQAGSAVKNTVVYETSVTSRVLIEQMRQLAGTVMGNVLLGAQAHIVKGGALMLQAVSDGNEI